MLKAEHDDLKAEIETREKTFSTVVALGEAMVKENHPAAKEVGGRARGLIAAYSLPKVFLFEESRFNLNAKVNKICLR
jgi:hypothetical protein